LPTLLQLLVWIVMYRCRLIFLLWLQPFLHLLDLVSLFSILGGIALFCMCLQTWYLMSFWNFYPLPESLSRIDSLSCRP
jgi:antibiotic biosynthesis monooxygenase (ABM) superfamily enzyme